MSSGNLLLLVFLLELLQLLLLLLALDEVRLLLRLFLTVTWAPLLDTPESVLFFVCEAKELLLEHLLLGLDLCDFDLFFLTCKASSRVYVYKISSSSSAALFSSSFFRACRWPSSQSFLAISTSSYETNTLQFRHCGVYLSTT